MTSCSGPLSSRGRGVAGEGRGLAQHPEAEGLVGAGERRRRRAAEPGRDGVAQPGGGDAGGREEEAGVGRGALLHRPHDPLDRHGALARPGAAEDAHDRAVGVDRGPLGGVEDGRPSPRR